MPDGPLASAVQKVEQDALADRIEAVLRGRKKIGAERRMQQRKIQEHAFAWHATPSGDAGGQPVKPDLSVRWNSSSGLALG